jgi:hypothetical protein
MMKSGRNVIPVDWSGWHLTPAGSSVLWRPRRSASDEEAPQAPRGKQVPGAEIEREFNSALSFFGVSL